MKKLAGLMLAVVVLGGCTSPPAARPGTGLTPVPTSIQPTPLPTIETGIVEGTMSATQDKLPTAATATIKTNRGTIVLKLYPDSAPKTVQNFISKAKSGYYNGLTFHRVEDWVIQGGDPDGNGTGGGDMPTELSQVPFKLGSLGVARGGDIKISNDSQFFVCTADCSWLSGQYTNFGEVVDGMETAKTTQIGDKIESITVSDGSTSL